MALTFSTLLRLLKDESFAEKLPDDADLTHHSRRSLLEESHECQRMG